MLLEHDYIDLTKSMHLTAKFTAQGVIIGGEEIVAYHHRPDAQALQGAHAAGRVLV